jgi:GNAT superfamily N-acetyltransferase
MNRYLSEAERLFLVIRKGKVGAVAGELAKRTFSNRESYLLRRDLTVPFQAAAAKQPIEIRPVRDSDIPEILRARPGRLLLLRANIPTCYVAVTASGAIAYMQWLIARGELERFKPFFDGALEELGEDEVLLEFAYTFEGFRGQKIMGAAMAAIAEKGRLSGARGAVTYVQTANAPALKGCAAAGFFPFMIREEKWRAFSFKESFRNPGDGAQRPLEPSYPQAAAEAPAVSRSSSFLKPPHLLNRVMSTRGKSGWPRHS